MSDSLLRQIRDRLTLIATCAAIAVVTLCLLAGIALYWHVKVDAARQRVLEGWQQDRQLRQPDRPPTSSYLTR